MLFLTERVIHLRLNLSRENLLQLLPLLPVDVDPFFLEALSDEAGSVDDLITEFWGASRATCYVAADAEAFLFARDGMLDLVLISFAGPELLEQFLSRAENALSSPER